MSLKVLEVLEVLEVQGVQGVLIRLMRSAVGAAALLVIFAGAADAQGKWQNMARFPERSQEIGGTAVNGKVYVFGGLADVPKGLVWEY